ncbi:MAG: PP2C family protein-serine/threonine phosphatase [Thermoanaerobaculia bacterium]
MKNARSILFWIALAVVAALVMTWAFPRAYPFFPQDWEISRQEAEAIALVRLLDLGELPPQPYVIVAIATSSELEHRLMSSLDTVDEEVIRESRLARDLMAWEVTVYDRKSRSTDWTYRARITPQGEVLQLQLRVPPEEDGGVIDAETARAEADRLLSEEEIDLYDYDEPEIRSRQLQSRTDMTLRYRDREGLLGEAFPYGMEVTFAGDRLAGFSTYFDDPQQSAIQATFQLTVILNFARTYIALLLLPLSGIPFVRRYHAGEIGVRRGVQIASVVAACGVVVLLFCARTAGAGMSIGLLTRPQVTFVAGVFLLMVLFFFPLALMALLSWSVGESICRERWGRKLAAFDALFKGDWMNATFAQASLRGLSSGLAALAGFWLLVVVLRSQGAWAYSTFYLGPWWESAAWFSIPLLGFGVAYAIYTGMFGWLLMSSLGVRHFGWVVGPVLAAVISGLVFFPLHYFYPFGWNILAWLLVPAVFIFLFLRFGIYTSILAYLTVWVGQGAIPFLGAADSSMQLQASLALLMVAVPLIVSARSLLSDRKFFYRYEDIPPHVRRIAERERQKVELETARGIQASILPDLPPEMNGVRMSHAYLPATEVGGDFYDVLALDDGRLAVAVGDVAGHGVSSGLVMSMAKSALAVQVTFDPDVEAVFATLNKMVFQSARKRLLATLCYALIDPQKKEMFYASAGHLFPFRLSADGDVEALESVSYPLGVRSEIDIRVRGANLASGDRLFLYSDGIIEARPEGSEELFGFDRLEESLKRHFSKDVMSLRDGVLEDVESFTGRSPREDDLTILVLQIP